MPFFALWAVRTLALVALSMPKKPDSTENSAPTRKQTAVCQPRMISKTTNMTAAKIAITTYWRFR